MFFLPFYILGVKNVKKHISTSWLKYTTDWRQFFHIYVKLLSVLFFPVTDQIAMPQSSRCSASMAQTHNPSNATSTFNFNGKIAFHNKSLLLLWCSFCKLLPKYKTSEKAL